MTHILHPCLIFCPLLYHFLHFVLVSITHSPLTISNALRHEIDNISTIALEETTPEAAVIVAATVASNMLREGLPPPTHCTRMLPSGPQGHIKSSQSNDLSLLWIVIIYDGCQESKHQQRRGLMIPLGIGLVEKEPPTTKGNDCHLAES